MPAVAALAVAAALVPVADVTTRERHLAVLACGAAVLIHVILGLLPRRYPRSLIAAVDAGLVVDGALVGVLAHLSGGTDSSALWLLPLVGLAATLGLSAANGVKAAALSAVVVGAVLAAEGGHAARYADHTGLFAMIAAVIGIAAGLSAVNERELRRRGERVAALHEASLAFEAADDPDALADAAGEVARRLMPGWHVAVELTNAVTPERMWRSEGFVHVVVPVAARPRGGGRSAAGERTLGSLTLRRPTPRVGPLRMRGQQLVALRTLARALAGALTRVDLVRRLEHMSATDPLTGLANRRVFNETLDAELARARRGDGHVAVALLDVDHFKRFNDTHGHQAGDEALVSVARVLTESARAGDRVCRVGGEEFALILPGADEAVAVEAADRFRRAVAEAGTPYGPVTASVGVAVSDGFTTRNPLVANADARLYEAKEAGRNRVAGPAPAAATSGPAR